MYPKGAISGPYTDSAHGNTTYGVNRSSISSFNYSKGNCAHCHEQHASIGGSEPTPTGGPDKYALFYKNHSSQTDNFCFKCHTDLNSLQGTIGALYNYSYSYRAGACPSSSCNENDILELFSYTSPNSSHNLNDILNFINGKWGYTSDSNPCVACHNPHRVQGDPANSSFPKSSSTRGWPVSRPSLHSKDNSSWGLWGDDPTERMSSYASGYTYQAPYRYGSTTTYEPDGSTTTDGSNLTDFVTFCTDCHNSINTISSTVLGTLKKINWETTGGDSSSAGDKHGKNYATNSTCLKPPYGNNNCTSVINNYVLSCLDCHEPHGAPNAFLIRKEVNGGILNGTVSTGTSDYGYLCGKCHLDDSNFGGSANRWEGVHHCKGDYPYNQSSCGSCHSGSGGTGTSVCGKRIMPAIPCSNCHYHGSSANATVSPSPRRTF